MTGQACVTYSGSSGILKWGKFYYKLGQLLKTWATVITKKAAITNWGKIFYKLGQLLQFGE